MNQKTIWNIKNNISKIFLTLLLIPPIVGLLTQIDLSPKSSKIATIIGTKLPDSATQVDYYFFSNFDGVQGRVCAQIDRADFEKILQQLSLKGNLIQRATLLNKMWPKESLPSNWYSSETDSEAGELQMAWNIYERELNPTSPSYTDIPTLSCWNSTNPENEETYFFAAPKYWRMIRYEGGKIFVVTDRYRYN